MIFFSVFIGFLSHFLCIFLCFVFMVTMKFTNLHVYLKNSILNWWAFKFNYILKALHFYSPIHSLFLMSCLIYFWCPSNYLFYCRYFFFLLPLSFNLHIKWLIHCVYCIFAFMGEISPPPPVFSYLLLWSFLHEKDPLTLFCKASSVGFWTPLVFACFENSLSLLQF